MPEFFDLFPATTVDPTPALADGWRRAAASLRQAAAEVGLFTHDVVAHHRGDVWRGAVATAFGDELEHWRSRLNNDHEPGLGAELRALADRLEARALATELGIGGPVGDLWARNGTSGPP